jgi:bifunctional NMN adenylyltransferase/nudix hydrolase
MKLDYEYAIVIGRFQPFHNAHMELLNLALSIGDKVILIVGSHDKASDPRDPFSSRERHDIIESVLTPEQKDRIIVLPIRDYLYNENTWLIEIQQKVLDITDRSKHVALVGHKSDITSYYLDSFPDWEFINYKTQHKLHATGIRELYFTHDVSYRQYVPENVARWLEEFKRSKKFSYLKDSFDELNEYKSAWEGAPFPPTFQTVDTVVIKSGHILLVRRRAKYGKGLLALPGGFVEQNETLREAAIRELKEETSIDLDKRTLFAAIKGEKTFDHPRRSLRGRTITQAFKLNLGIGALNLVKGDSDADKAFWLPLAEYYTRSSEFFEDHWHIIYNFINNDDGN